MNAHTIRDWIEYRRRQLADEAVNAHPANSIGSGASIQAAQDRKFAHDVLNELERMAQWIHLGSPDYVPPLSEERKKEWRFARDHGAEVPPHILEQL